MLREARRAHAWFARVDAAPQFGQGLALFLGQHLGVIQHLAAAQATDHRFLLHGQLAQKFVYGKFEAHDGLGFMLEQQGKFFIQKLAEQGQRFGLAVKIAVYQAVHDVVLLAFTGRPRPEYRVVAVRVPG